jgi:hypothetical protein
MQVSYVEDIGRNHAAVEKCGKEKEESDNITVFESFPA